ncbi:MAG: acetyl-CoA acetyltransferase, partial [Francisellaceae bacterium]|nr:acetyl-CoA acetyltransferase [Francisellaceae bacterium]
MIEQDVYIIDGLRTPFIKAGAKPNPLSASDLAVSCGRPLLARQPFNSDAIEEVIIGSVMPSSKEANIARLIGLRL